MRSIFTSGSALYAGIGVIILFGGSNAYLFIQTQKLGAELASTTQEISENLDALEQKSLSVSDELYASQQNIAAIQSRVGGFESTLGTLEKLSKTDPELLQKYSKVFFLNEHYAPARLAEIEKAYLYSEDRLEKINADVQPYLERMLNKAQDDDVELFVKSAYRSFNEQTSLKSSYTVTYGAGSANQFSADQGYSEHQLGTAVDFISKGQGGALAGFDKTAAYQWMLAHAHEYGFILSYPENNGYYIFEPWHWRFVGVKLASSLHRREKHFYDLEQREIDTYLADIFD
ncbi:MAG: M15 family metallopeptidase [Patescibacteria group bacterium]